MIFTGKFKHHSESSYFLPNTAFSRLDTRFNIS
ncbi:hypothetical protein SAMN04488072_101353 [Lentibacillus halodurans]|uniref:Uncharacterized protein n=1 Tax=Lentibacillus halodurans TaxID=237679 RepID=A0A1I0VFU0_9BACI|nr:hypothetical protein SAMN04488072_101353 [Lentibacillus halodurans]